MVSSPQLNPQSAMMMHIPPLDLGPPMDMDLTCQEDIDVDALCLAAAGKSKRTLPHVDYALSDGDYGLSDMWETVDPERRSPDQTATWRRPLNTILRRLFSGIITH